MTTLIIFTKEGCPACERIKQVNNGVSHLDKLIKIAKPHVEKVLHINFTGSDIKKYHPDIYNIVPYIPTIIITKTIDWEKKTNPLPYEKCSDYMNEEIFKSWVIKHSGKGKGNDKTERKIQMPGKIPNAGSVILSS